MALPTPFKFAGSYKLSFEPRGGFVERLDPEGRADHLAPRRVRVQARQIYSFAMAAQRGWYPQGREIALRGVEYLLAKARGSDGKPGYVHLLSPDGAVTNGLRDTYDHAFVLLALATVFAATKDARSRGLTASHFSFNVPGGRCEACQGEGVVRVEMQFLADVFVPCDQCDGKRFKPQILDVKYRGKNINHVLELTPNGVHVYGDIG